MGVLVLRDPRSVPSPICSFAGADPAGCTTLTSGKVQPIRAFDVVGVGLKKEAGYFPPSLPSLSASCCGCTSVVPAPCWAGSPCLQLPPGDLSSLGSIYLSLPFVSPASACWWLPASSGLHCWRLWTFHHLCTEWNLLCCTIIGLPVLHVGLCCVFQYSHTWSQYNFL